MSLLAQFDSRLARLSLHSRLWAVVASLALPMLAAALLAGLVHLYAVQGWRAYSAQEQVAVQLAHKAGADLRLLDTPATRAAALLALRAQMRDVAALSGAAAVRRAAQAVTTSSYEYEEQAKGGVPPPAAAALAPLVDMLSARAAEASEASRERASQLAMAALVAMFLLPALATGAGIVLARRLTHSIDGTLRDCIAFASAIASDNFSHGSNHARAAARAKRLDADADSASEFDILVRSMNRLADETAIAAKRHADNTNRLRRLERSWALLSACWQSQLRATDEKSFLTAVCSHLCEHGGYRAAWIGYAREDRQRSIEVVAHGGTDANYIHKLALSWGDDVHQQGGFGTAIHQKRVMTTSELVTDMVFNAADRPTVPHGLLAAAALPLRTDKDSAPFGVLGIYSVHAEPFEADELKLLQTLVDDLVLGIGRTRLHAQCLAVAAAAGAEAEQRAAHPVYFDNLTGLATLATLERKLAPLAAQAAAAHRKLGALHVNLDSFDVLNDKLGVQVADQVLVQTALRIAQAAGERAVLARPGADEFIVLLPGLASAAHAGKIAARIASALAQPVEASLLPPDTPLLKLMCSTGISLYPDDAGDSPDGGPLLAHAAQAMQQAKQQGGNTYRYYAAALNTQVAQRAAMELELSHALEHGELLLYYQPQASLAHGGINCAEALLRWQHPQRGVLAPLDFIRQAEETGLVLPFGAWAIERACRQIKEWTAQGLHTPPVAVNLPASQFLLPGLVDTVQHALDSTGAPAALLVLEIGEQALMHNPQAAAATLRQLKELGVGLVLDDFGSSQASLYCLKEFPFDRLKIDPALVHELGASPSAGVLCGAIVSMAHTLGVKVLADGVESEAQLHCLQQRHCDAVQGALFSKALPADGYAALLAAGKKLAITAKPAQAPDDGAVVHTLLLVDAEAATLRALNRVLKGEGSKILAASSGADALALLEINPVQAVVCGERLSDMSGVDFLVQAAQQRPGAERILLAGDDSYATALDALNSGAARRIFPKPWSDAQLRDCVYQPALQG